MSKEVEQIDYISAEYYIFYIKVVDSAGKGVKDVRIEWEDTNGSGAGYVYSDSSGIAIVNIDMNKVPPEFELPFTAKKEGFGGEDGQDAQGLAGQDTSRQYPFVLRLTEVTNMYYHVVYVKSSNGTYLSNVIVKAYLSDLVDEQTESSQVQVTDLSGKCIFKREESNDFYFLATKNGFVPSVLTRHEARSTLDAAERFPLTITLAPSESGHYYYVVKVENEKGEGMADIEIGLYKDMSRTTVYDSGGNSVVRGRRVSAEDTSIDREVFNTVRDTISVISGWPVNTIILDTAYMNNSGLQISQTNMIKIINSLEREYGIVFNEGADSLPVEERVSLFTSMYPTVRDTVDYIRENADFQGKVKISYVTDSAGYLAIDLGVLTQAARSIYAWGLMDNYVWNYKQCLVNASVSPDTPGGKLEIFGGSGTGEYYNVQIVDAYTGNPVRDAEVRYFKGDSEVADKKSNDDGIVVYRSFSGPISIRINKEGYENMSVSNIPGLQTAGQYTKYELMQVNPIRVVYKYEEGEEPVPAPGILVSVGYYDSGNNYIECLRHKTASSGYIDGISNGYFASGGNTYYAIILNYTPKEMSDRAALRKRLVLGGLVIVLPEGAVPGEDTEYMQFYDMTANSIKKNVNTGNGELETSQVTDKVSYSGGDDYRINILDPDSVTTYDIFQSKPVMMENNHRSVIGSIDIGLKYDVNKLRLKVINRYSGYYNPIFNDVLFYNDIVFNNDRLPFSNVSFDYGYEDNYGKFGMIKNLWFHKVNDDKGISILNTSEAYYPLTGQYALDYRDYNVFESNWDLEHYTKQMDIDHSKPCMNISSQKNGICMFGSKYLNVPNKIEIYGLTLGDNENWDGAWNDDWITNPAACPGEVMLKEINDNRVEFYFFFTKRIHRFFYDKLRDEFEKYMNVDSGSYGKPGVEDDIREYVAKNVLKLYRLEKVRVFVKRTKKGQHNSRIENDYTKYLEYDKTSGDPAVAEYFEKKGYVQYFKQHGFVEVRNVSLNKINRDDFDRKLVYNLRNGAQEEFGFGFILTKI